MCGVYENHRIGNLIETDVRPSMRFAASPDSTLSSKMPYLVIGLDEINAQSMKTINDKLAELLPDQNLELISYSEAVKESYSEINKVKRSFVLGFIMAILIAVFGLIGYVRDENFRRSKEVAVRKVNGAVSSEIVRMMAVNILKISVPCVILGDVVSWFVAHGFLQMFSERMPLGFWYFLLADIAVIAVIVSTVVWGSLKIAYSNPVESLKSE